LRIVATQASRAADQKGFTDCAFVIEPEDEDPYRRQFGARTCRGAMANRDNREALKPFKLNELGTHDPPCFGSCAGPAGGHGATPRQREERTGVCAHQVLETVRPH
jgi:hypothetical protein